jgi:hypothetical protein
VELVVADVVLDVLVVAVAPLVLVEVIVLVVDPPPAPVAGPFVPVLPPVSLLPPSSPPHPARTSDNRVTAARAYDTRRCLVRVNLLVTLIHRVLFSVWSSEL